jgi:serine/threonine-protein kinase
MCARFGKFVLLQRIGGGRLSQVFRVSRAGGEARPPKVALKRVHPSLIGQPDFVQLVVREAGLITRLSHPNLCVCHELGVIDGSPFLTLDLVDGCTLRALLRRLSKQGAKLPPSAVAALAQQLAEVLSYLHARSESPLVHLDLSPQNVMVSVQGEVKLIDFGIARYLDGHEPPPIGEKIAGTIGYMSPEQARGAFTDGRADQFGLGILLWEMLTGRRLYRGNTAETWRRMRSGAVPPAAIALQEAPENLRRVVVRLVQPEPADRFVHIEDLQATIEVISASRSSGQRLLAALVQHLMRDPAFDPFDVRTPPEPELSGADIPAGDTAIPEEYAELRIEVDHGAGTPGGLVRSLLSEVSPELPTSPFLEPGDMEAAVEGG